jgi:chromosome segregation ATPase
VTLDGDQISGKGVMVGGYVNPSRIYIQKYLLFSETVSTIAKLWKEYDELDNQVNAVTSGMCQC